jgi:pimeloyl-ACP methyl ester carboxylesterase
VKLEFDRGGDGPRLLVLLHGLGATHHVWDNMLAATRWHGSWIAPDLRGHGASPHAGDYALSSYAGDVGELVAGSGSFEEIVVLGHSMGGAIALALASGRHGFQPSHAFGLGIKVAWNDNDLAGMRKIANAPVRTFEAQGDAIARYLKLSGLSGFVSPDSEAAYAGVVGSGDAWRLANDPRTASVGAPPMMELLAAAKAPIHLACGEKDMMVNREQLAVYAPKARTLPGGHNAMVESPRAVWDWLEETIL